MTVVPYEPPPAILWKGQLGLVVCGEAEDGLDAIEKTRELKPDLVILDFQMPRKTNLPALRQHIEFLL